MYEHFFIPNCTRTSLDYLIIINMQFNFIFLHSNLNFALFKISWHALGQSACWNFCMYFTCWRIVRLLRHRPHYSVFKRKRSCFAPFTKRFASTLIVFACPHYNADQERSHMVASVRHFGYPRSSGLSPGRVYLMTPPFSDRIVFIVDTRKQRFQIAPLWSAFLNDSVFGDRFRRCSVDDGRIRSKTSLFLVWRQIRRISVDGALIAQS